MKESKVIRIQDLKGNVLYETPGSWDKVPFDELNLEDAQLEGLVWEGAYLEDAKLSHANLKNADLYWCAARGASFEGANLENVDFKGATCTQTNFRKANLTKADFTQNNLGSAADLSGADLRTPSLFQALLTGARYSDAALFPEGFDPALHGMVRVESSQERAERGMCQ
jgi:uncharacterized protein YjbI with pentapeptide repeats